MAEYVINTNKQQFTQADVLRAVNAPFRPLGVEDLSAMTLNNWIKRGHLPKLSEHTPGSGRRRLFSAKDAVQIYALTFMSNLNIPVGDASNLLHYFRERIDGKSFNLFPWRGTLSLILMPGPKGKFKFIQVYEKDLEGNPTDVSNLDKLPGFILLNVDFIIDMVAEELSKILAESGEADNQEDDGEAFDLQIERHWQKKFAESVIELEGLEESLKSENREPTDKEKMRLFELRQIIEDGKLILKPRRRQEDFPE